MVTTHTAPGRLKNIDTDGNLLHIASFAFCGDSLLTLAELTPRSWYAANEFLKFPHIGIHRVTGVHEMDPAVRSVGLGDENFLWSASFRTSCRRSKESQHRDTDHIIVTQRDSHGFGSKAVEGNLCDVWNMLPRELASFLHRAPSIVRPLESISPKDHD